MKNAISDFCQSVFALLLLLAVVVAGVVTLMFLSGLVIGGPTATSLALNGSSLLGVAMKATTIAVFVGVVVFYIHGKHELTLTDQGEAADDTEATH
jgi:uncharacterized membrane protein SpoIIM required for sporulation